MNAPEFVRFSLILHYHGAPFHGWQLQLNAPTVQGELERVLARLNAGVRVPVTGSGRTDRGVHATGQVVTAVLPARWTAAELRRSLNALLPRSMWVEEVRRVPDAFHPRFGARRRSYAYQVGTVPLSASPFLRAFCWPVLERLPDGEGLAAAAALVPGDRSWKAFARAGQEARGDRSQVFAASWTPWLDGDGTPLGWRFHITATRYLHHMVRYLVGTMMAVARGDRPLAEFDALLNVPGTPLVTSPPAPPEGLFLSRVEYEEGAFGTDPDRDPVPASDYASAPATDEASAPAAVTKGGRIPVTDPPPPHPRSSTPPNKGST
ncbi:tRNA pseudouridine(38-40) synthase TruA [soil metagenome]